MSLIAWCQRAPMVCKSVASQHNITTTKSANISRSRPGRKPEVLGPARPKLFLLRECATQHSRRPPMTSSTPAGAPFNQRRLAKHEKRKYKVKRERESITTGAGAGASPQMYLPVARNPFEAHHRQSRAAPPLASSSASAFSLLPGPLASVC